VFVCLIATVLVAAELLYCVTDSLDYIAYPENLTGPAYQNNFFLYLISLCMLLLQHKGRKGGTKGRIEFNT